MNRTVLLIVAVVLILAVPPAAYFLLLRERPTPAPEAVAPPLPPVAGKTYLVKYFPVNPDDEAQRDVAQMLTKTGKQVSFDSAGRYVFDAGSTLLRGDYRFQGDTLFWDDDRYRYEPTPDGALLTGDTVFKLKLELLR